MTQDNCLCQEAGVLIFPCSGGSDVGELSDRVGRKMAQCGQAKMYCLAGIGAHIPGMIESTKAATKLIAIDGCQVSCAKKLLENAGFKVNAFNLKEMGFEKGKTAVNDHSIEKALNQIKSSDKPKKSSDSSGSCGCGCS